MFFAKPLQRSNLCASHRQRRWLTHGELKPPRIAGTENSVVVVIKHDPLASPEESVMDYLGNHELITNRIARELTGITSENSMKEVFYRLAKRELIERVPGRLGASAAWQKRTIPNQ